MIGGGGGGGEHALVKEILGEREKRHMYTYRYHGNTGLLRIAFVNFTGLTLRHEKGKKEKGRITSEWFSSSVC